MMFPGYGGAVEGFFRILGYEIDCYDLHGGNRCVIRVSRATLSRRESENDLKFAKNFGCQSDGDCFKTSGGQCVTGSILSGQLNTVEKNHESSQQPCICMKGPVQFGCLSKN